MQSNYSLHISTIFTSLLSSHLCSLDFSTLFTSLFSSHLYLLHTSTLFTFLLFTSILSSRPYSLHISTLFTSLLSGLVTASRVHAHVGLACARAPWFCVCILFRVHVNENYVLASLVVTVRGPNGGSSMHALALGMLFLFISDFAAGGQEPMTVCPGQRRLDSIGVKTYLQFSNLSSMATG